jgi:cell division septum initiation protein DivIVA
MPELSFDYSRYVLRGHFRRRLLGYRPADVDTHLQVVSGWFSLTGLDKVLEERGRELQEELERRLADAEQEASRILADARRDADEMRAAAEEGARAIVEAARREAALEQRGRSRIGRPLGQRANRR